MKLIEIKSQIYNVFFFCYPLVRGWHARCTVLDIFPIELDFILIVVSYFLIMCTVNHTADFLLMQFEEMSQLKVKRTFFAPKQLN